MSIFHLQKKLFNHKYQCMTQIVLRTCAVSPENVIHFRSTRWHSVAPVCQKEGHIIRIFIGHLPVDLCEV